MNPWEAWASAFSGCPPIGYMLRASEGTRWFRIHALARGKRAPETTPEWAELLRRQNIVASAVLGCGAQCTAWLTHYGRDNEVPPGAWIAAPEPPSWALGESDAQDLGDARVFCMAVRWEPGVVDDYFRLMASGKLGPLTVFASATGSAVCPYEGGMDVFLAKTVRVAPVRAMFEPWLAPPPLHL